MSDKAGTGSGLGTSGRSERPSRSASPRRPGRLKRVVTFFRQVIAELRKVIWPTRNELITYTSVVLVFVMFMVVIVSIYDFLFSQGVLKVFGN
ncbi:MAG: preprotein translocase, SecE subunit [Frankiales bacterium]|jgi:preprotein translocase subunit SecE|nr:preprotein translocase, SecE subunit [Frankiales bacterium]